MRLFRNRTTLEGVVPEEQAIGPTQADEILRELNKGETNDPQEALERVREAPRNIVHAQSCVHARHRGDKESFYSRPNRARARGLGHRDGAKRRARAEWECELATSPGFLHTPYSTLTSATSDTLTSASTFTRPPC